jgi:hypothetical protein
MYQDLYEYLLLNGQLNLPGIGTIVLEKKAAEIDFAHRQINPPAYSIALRQDSASGPARKFFYWLSDRWNMQHHEAIVKFNGFVLELKNQVLAGKKVVWDHVGTLTKGMSGDIRFEPALKQHQFDQPVNAPRIIRDKAVHTVRVGEQEKSSVEMAEWLNPGEEARTYWWAPALIAAILLVIFMGLYFSQKGINISSVGNQRRVTPQVTIAAPANPG